MALAQTANRGIARHLANRLNLMGEQKRRRAQPCRGRSGFAARMAAADNYDIICGLCAHGGDIEGLPLSVELSVQGGQIPKMFHVEHFGSGPKAILIFRYRSLRKFGQKLAPYQSVQLILLYFSMTYVNLRSLIRALRLDFAVRDRHFAQQR